MAVRKVAGMVDASSNVIESGFLTARALGVLIYLLLVNLKKNNN
jgi:hypothetical protein